MPLSIAGADLLPVSPDCEELVERGSCSHHSEYDPNLLDAPLTEVIVTQPDPMVSTPRTAPQWDPGPV
ncbi:hypothetical protein P7K49_008148, partial [Saguinus oedipus]